MMWGTTTREPNNQSGKDAAFDEVEADIHAPVKFDRQRKREIFHRRDGCMHGFANENRFIAFNDTTTVNTKFVLYQSPQFGKWADHSIDEYIKNYSSCANENATHTNYNPRYHLVHKDLSAGLPNFDRYISKE